MAAHDGKAQQRVGGVGQVPFAPSMLLALLISAYGHGETSSRAIERLCRRDAGYRQACARPHGDCAVMPAAVFATALRMCRDAELIRLVVLDGTKVKANASLEANRSAATLDEQVRRMLAEAESTDKCKDRPFGPGGGKGCRGRCRGARTAWPGSQPQRRMPAFGRRRTRRTRRRNARCSALFIATCQDRKQRAELREAASPRGRMRKGLSARQRMQRKLRTKRGRTIYAKRGVSVELVIGQMKDRQGAGQFSMRGLGACRGEWHVRAAVHNLRKLQRESVRRRAAGGRMDEKQERRA
jgi:hypothetical protein